MNKYLEKIAEFEKEAGNPAAIARALAQKTLGKPKGWKITDMKPAELSFNRDTLARAATDLHNKAMTGTKLKKVPQVIQNTNGVSGTFQQAQNPQHLGKLLERRKVVNQLDYLKRTQPRKPAAPKPPGGL